MADRIQIAVAALVRDGRVLLAHRHPERTAYPDCWDLVGGHVEPGERPEQAVVRECREELGVEVHDPRALTLPDVDPALDLHAFIVTSWEGEPVNAAPDEHDELRWFGPEELADLPLAHPAGRTSIERAVRGSVQTSGAERPAQPAENTPSGKAPFSRARATSG